MAGLSRSPLGTRGAAERSLGDYVRFARRNVSVLAVCALLGLAVGGYLELRAPKSFTATASVLLAPVPTYVSLVPSGPAPSEITIDTDAQLLHFEDTLDRVAVATREPVASVAEHLNVTAPTSTRVLIVSFTAQSREAASVGAATAAAALLDTRRELLTSLQANQITRISNRVKQIQADVDKFSGNIIVAVHRQELLSQIGVLAARRDALRAARVTPGEVIEAATPPNSSDPAYPTLPIGSGAMVGLLVGVVLGIVRDALRTQRSSSILSTSPANR